MRIAETLALVVLWFPLSAPQARADGLLPPPAADAMPLAGGGTLSSSGGQEEPRSDPGEMAKNWPVRVLHPEGAPGAEQGASTNR